MTDRDEDSGVALLCGSGGNLIRVIRDGLGLAGRLAPGQSIAEFAAPSERAKIGHFLAVLQQKHGAFDWEINVPDGDTISTLRFAGGGDGDRLMILAARTRSALVSLRDELMSLDNDRATLLRAMAGDLPRQSQELAERDSRDFDAFSRLNNELAALQRELAKKNIELERLNADKNRFLGMAAHDLRSPLGIIQSMSEFLEEEAGPQLSEEHREFVTTIKTTSQFLLRLINDLLDISAIESGKLTLALQPTDLAGLIQRNVALNRVLADKKRIGLEFHADADWPDIPIDAGKIEQVLNNFISNAIKFSLPGTSIIVRLGREDDRAVVSVRDQGQGIPADELEKLFKPFQKTSVKSTAGEHSTGLGLSIARRIVEGHGGRVWVESVVGEGSTFCFAIPPGSLAPDPAV